jgi:hypothetical protein
MDVPSDKIQMALVVRPSYPFAEVPVTLLKILSPKGLEQRPIELLQTMIGWLSRTTPQEHRQPDTPPFELSVMEQDCALQGRYGNGRRLRLGGAEHRRGTRLIMILDESDQLLLIRSVSVEMLTDTVSGTVLQAIV